MTTQAISNEDKLKSTLTDMVCGDQLVSFVQDTVKLQLGGAKKIIVKDGSGKKKTEIDGVFHKDMPLVLQAATTGENIALVGPTGSGKTTMAMQVAESLGLKFAFTGAIQHEHKLTGFIDANGNYKPTAFYDIFVNGGLFLWDEYDASGTAPILAFQAAMANGLMDFPDGIKKKHPDCHIMASLNTWGLGRDRNYVGRNKMDSAAMDRLTVQLEIGYDEDLERMISSNSAWTSYVIKARHAIMDLGLRHIVSPRVSIAGGKMLDVGMEPEVCLRAVLWKGMPEADQKKVVAKIGAYK